MPRAPYFTQSQIRESLDDLFIEPLCKVRFLLEQCDKCANDTTPIRIRAYFDPPLIFDNMNARNERPPAINAPVGMRMHAPLANHAIEKTRMNAGGRVDRVAGCPLQVKNNRLLALEKSVKVTAAERPHIWLRPAAEGKVFPVGNSLEVSANENFFDHGLCRPAKNAHPW
ncbi:MAG: hypothetical protein WA147_11930 [Polaromonas sp.]